MRAFRGAAKKPSASLQTASRAYGVELKSSSTIPVSCLPCLFPSRPSCFCPFWLGEAFPASQRVALRVRPVFWLPGQASFLQAAQGFLRPEAEVSSLPEQGLALPRVLARPAFPAELACWQVAASALLQGAQPVRRVC